MQKGPPLTDPLPSSDTKSSNLGQASEDSMTTDDRRDIANRGRRRAEPEYQDGSYGFEAINDNQMDVDLGSAAPVSANAPVAAPAPAPRAPSPPVGRRDDREYDRRDNRYPSYPRDYGRSRYDDRDRRYGLPPNDRRLYSDSMYQRPRPGYR